MKKTLFILFVFLLGTSQLFAALLRVNNRSGINANYSSLSSAISAASAGDTIYVEPSTSSYGSISLTKKLTIIGNGYFATPSAAYIGNTSLQADTNECILGGVSFNAGSAGSVIMGMVFYGYNYISDSNITLKRNMFYGYYTYLYYANVSNLDIRQNVFYSAGFYDYGSYTSSNINFQNNLLYNTTITLPTSSSGFMQNNIFDNSGLNANNFQVNNNIMINGSFTANNCVYFNNIGTGTQFGNANNNQQNVGTATLFANYSSGTETRYTLSSTGPGVGAGFNGVDVGIFGGPDPYKLSGIPPVPTIYSLSAPATTTSTTLSVTISTRSND